MRIALSYRAGRAEAIKATQSTLNRKGPIIQTVSCHSGNVCIHTAKKITLRSWAFTKTAKNVNVQKFIAVGNGLSRPKLQTKES